MAGEIEIFIESEYDEKKEKEIKKYLENNGKKVYFLGFSREKRKIIISFNQHSLYYSLKYKKYLFGYDFEKFFNFIADFCNKMNIDNFTFGNEDGIIDEDNVTNLDSLINFPKKDLGIVAISLKPNKYEKHIDKIKSNFDVKEIRDMKGFKVVFMKLLEEMREEYKKSSEPTED